MIFIDVNYVLSTHSDYFPVSQIMAYIETMTSVVAYGIARSKLSIIYHCNCFPDSQILADIQTMTFVIAYVTTRSKFLFSELESSNIGLNSKNSISKKTYTSVAQLNFYPSFLSAFF